MAKSEIAPSACPDCGRPAYLGLNSVECTGPTCRNYHKETAGAYQAERFPSVDLFEDEPTQPRVVVKPNATDSRRMDISIRTHVWAMVYGWDRMPGETDEELVNRIRKERFFSPGSSL